MMKALLTLALSLGLLVSFADAHGGMEHVMGAIAGISATSITVTTTDGRAQTVLLTAETKYARNDTAILLGDLKVGDAVVIHATRKNDPLTAVTVKVGASRGHAEMGGMKMDRGTPSQPPK